MKFRMLSWGLLAAATSIAATASSRAAGVDKIEFNRDIRPILADKCFACHGPDEHQRKAKMRLDTRAGAFGVADDGAHPFVPGKPGESEVAARIRSRDPEEIMPPPKFGKALNAAEIAKIERWISEGAVWSEHWSFAPPKRVEPPAIPNQTHPLGAIDRFVRARLASEGLQPAPAADRRTLIRRVSLDLTGLPPSPDEVNAFVNDKSENAYEKVVDRLLKSPRYGERMAEWWLDLARYADSNGYQADFERYMWRWRDYVIDAFNSNMKFDRFTIEQIAGDMLPNATLDQRIATGFNRNHRINTEGGIIAEEWRVEGIVDRVETTSLVWLGLTMGCARCHDHKYDPITQKEFYKLFGFYNSIAESGTGVERPVNHPPILKAPRPFEAEKLAALRAVAVAAESEVTRQEKQLGSYLPRWEKETREQLEAQRAAWPLLTPTKLESRGGATLTRRPDGSILASGKNPNFDVYTIEFTPASQPITALRLELIPDPSLPNQSFGRHVNGNFVLSGVEVETTAPGSKTPTKYKITKAVADYSQEGWPIEAAIAGTPGKGWAADGHVKEKRVEREAMFIPDRPIAAPAGSVARLVLHFEALDQHNLGRFRVTTTSGADPKLPTPLLPSAVAGALFADPYARTSEQNAALFSYARTHAVGPLGDAVRALEKARAELKAYDDSISTVMVMAELDKPREGFVLIRGQYDQHGERVEPGLPAVLPPMPSGRPMNRLGLAYWLVDPSNPLTARVQVNRFWELLFGVGIVKSSENFGVQGDWPSHPELLDWLATEFIRVGWDIKAIIKEIVMSETYRQASTMSPMLIERDPENRLLARGPRFRLPAETIRDQALAISGMLVEQVGGPSVRPYQPEGIWDELNVYGNLRNYKHDNGPGLHRRSMYTIWKRTAAPPQMLLFDAPAREVCTIHRPRTNTPLQALVLLNDITFIEISRVFAQHMIKSGGSTAADRLTWAFERAIARRPGPAELSILTARLDARLKGFRADPNAAKQLVAQGDAPLDPTIDPAELAAYTTAASVILNLDEVITKE